MSICATDLREGRHRFFDLVFIDADKANNSNCFAKALKPTRPASIIIADSVAREGRGVDAASKHPNIAIP
jgi:predicted O-methyltransferase YrrM